ncbi:hypothetical protein D3C80_1696320 [compost metagenome]
MAAELCQVQQNGSRLEQHDVGSMVDQYRDAACRVEREKAWLQMLTVLDANMLQAVGQAHLFESDGGFEAVGRAVGVQHQRGIMHVE